MIKVVFPNAQSSTNDGPNDSAAEHFSGNILSHLARECAQNSIDAKPKSGEHKPVVLEFKLEKFSKKDIPCLVPEIKDAWSASQKRWPQQEYKSLFSTATRTLSSDFVEVLVISDMNTVGLLGMSDVSDESTGTWSRLVNSTGVANSNLGAGGSFGIGKMAPFAASATRTVFYQTYSEDGWGFQGVSRLMTHVGPDGKKKQRIGMIGSPSVHPVEKYEMVIPVCEFEQIPKAFKKHRPPGVKGTDIFIIGFKKTEDNWEKDIMHALVTNFFPAILDGLVEFVVQGVRIEKSNLVNVVAELRKNIGSVFDKSALQELDSTLWFIKAMQTSSIKTKIFDIIGEVKLGLVQASPNEIRESGDMPNQCFMCRSNKMRIFLKKYNQVPFSFAAFFICDNKEGNELLRQMEPPTHTAWERDRDKTPKHSVDNILKKVYEWIRDEIMNLAPPQSADFQSLDEIAKAIKSLKSEQNQENGGNSDRFMGNLPVRKGELRSPFSKIKYSSGVLLDAKRPKKPVPTPVDKPPVPPPELIAIKSSSKITYLGEAKYQIELKIKDTAINLNDVKIKIYAINFSNSPDAIDFNIINQAEGMQLNDQQFISNLNFNNKNRTAVFEIATRIDMLRLGVAAFIPKLNT